MTVFYKQNLDSILKIPVLILLLPAKIHAEAVVAVKRMPSQSGGRPSCFFTILSYCDLFINYIVFF